MKGISTEFYLVTLFLILIFIVNTSHILYLTLYKHNKRIKSLRLLLISSSLCSLIVSLWLIPVFYFRTLWSSGSILWRLWSFFFHIVDAVQLYTLLLLITIHSFQRFLICLIWLAPVIAYSPLLWLPSSSSLHDDIDYLPYQALIINAPWWIFPMIYFSMYLIPMIISLVLTSIRVSWPLVDLYYKKRKQNENFDNQTTNEHHEDMIELKNLIETVFNFQLEESKPKSKSLYTSISSWSKSISNKFNRSLPLNVDQHKAFVLFDELSSYPLIHSSSTQTKDSIEQPLNSCLLLVITCLLLFVHLPYILLSLIDVSLVRLSTFIYIHWFSSLFMPLIHLK